MKNLTCTLVFAVNTVAVLLTSHAGEVDPDRQGGTAAVSEVKATVVSKRRDEIKVKTKDGEKTFAVGSKTKGIENAKEGSKVTVKYNTKDGQLRASEINPR